MNRNALIMVALCLPAGTAARGTPPEASPPYPIVDTRQIRCYDDRTETEYPRAGAAFYGQDAQYSGNQPAYRDNGDGTVCDLLTGLMWTRDPGEKMIYSDAVANAKRCRVGGYDDWRLPTIKELYSLILFSGTDPDPRGRATAGLQPFIADKYFKFTYGREADGDRIIDSQFATSAIYRSTTMHGNKTMFGVNFADGRIKGYPIGATGGGGRRGGPRGRPEKKYYVLYVRGNPEYGKNLFHDNGDGTVTDRATGLTWMQVDSGRLKAGPHADGGLDWEQALAWAEGLTYAGHSDWRLPNAKELQSLVDYSRSPDSSDSPAIDPLFKLTPIRNAAGEKDYAFYWTSTTHVRQGRGGGTSGVYIAFGRALGWMESRRTGQKTLLDVHGAGAQRSDPKSGDPSRFPEGRGPQGDVVRIYNYAICVRGGVAEPRTSGPAVEH